MAILAECPACHGKQSLRNVKKKVCCYCGDDLDKAKRSKRIRYWIDYALPGGKTRREAIGFSIDKARDCDAKRRVQKAENRILDVKQDTRMTFGELADWYLGLEKVKSLSCYVRRTRSLKDLSEHFGNTPLSQIKLVDLEDYQAKRKALGRADATVDQDLETAKTMAIKAFDNDIISGDALKVFKRVKKLLPHPNANARDRILSREEYDRLMEQAKPHLKPIIATGYFTGMREGEILGLTWDKVDLKERVIRLDAEDTKDREKRDIPIFDELYDILKGLPRSLQDNHVFLYNGKRIRDIYGTLRTACRKAGIAYGRFVKGGFVFHDLRHTFNTNMRKAGVADSVIMKITGHSTREMFDRYNKIDRQDAEDAMGKLKGFFRNLDQETEKTALTGS